MYVYVCMCLHIQYSYHSVSQNNIGLQNILAIIILLDASLAAAAPIYLSARLFVTEFYSKTAETTETSYKYWLRMLL